MSSTGARLSKATGLRAGFDAAGVWGDGESSDDAATAGYAGVDGDERARSLR